jgi:hypothetical protein
MPYLLGFPQIFYRLFIEICNCKNKKDKKNKKALELMK